MFRDPREPIVESNFLPIISSENEVLRGPFMDNKGSNSTQGSETNVAVHPQNLWGIFLIDHFPKQNFTLILRRMLHYEEK